MLLCPFHASIAWALFCVGQVASASEVVTLEKLYGASPQFHPNQQNSLPSLDIAKNDVALEKVASLPNINLSTDIVDSSSDGSDYEEVKLSVQQPLYNRANTYKLKIAEQKYIEDKQPLLIEIADIYTQVLIQKKKQTLIEQVLKEAKILHKTVQLDQKPSIDLYRAAADVADKQASLIASNGKKQQLIHQLMSYLETPMDTMDVIDFAAADFSQQSDKQNQHPTLQCLLLEQKQLAVVITAAQHASVPTVGLVFELSHRNSSSILQSQTNDEVRGTVSLNWNLYNGNANRYKTNNAKTRATQNTNEYKAMQAEVGKKS